MANVRALSLRRSGTSTFPQGLNTMVLVLTWAASAVDAISYLGLGHVFSPPT
jgi:hypothetical protein